MAEKRSRPRILLIVRAVVVRGDHKVLLIKRAKDDRWAPGLWEFPGGKLDKGQDMANALVREVLEETGLVAIPTNRLVFWDSKTLTDGPYAGLPCVILVGEVKPIGGKVRLSSDHEGFLWAGLEKALKLDLTEETRKALLVLKKKSQTPFTQG